MERGLIMPNEVQHKSSEILPTGIDWYWDEWRFVWMALRWSLIPWRRKTPWKKIEHIRRRLLLYLASLYEGDEYTKRVDALDATWSEMREKLRKRPVLAQFMLEYGVYSEFFYPFLLRVPEAPTLEVACGYCYDLLGRLREIPRTDAMYPFYRGDEMFQWIDLRIRGEQQYLRAADRIMFIGGGLLQALRRNGYPLGEIQNGVQQEIVSYDRNLDLKEPLEDVFERPLSELGITCVYKDADEAFAESRYHEYFDVVDASGVLSYRKDDAELRYMLEGMLKMTRKGGKIVFDLQVLTLTLLFDKLILGWETQPSMKPETNVKKAIELVRRICGELGVKVEVVYQRAIGVQFVIYK